MHLIVICTGHVYVGHENYVLETNELKTIFIVLVGLAFRST